MDERMALEQFIEEDLAEAAEAGRKAVEKQFEKDTAGGMEHFTGLAGIMKDRQQELVRIVEEDLDSWYDEDHIIRGED